MAGTNRVTGRLLENPRWITALFNNTEFAWLWLMARVYIGWHWLDSGWGKLTSDSWMSGGTALQGFWQRAVVVPDPPGRPPIAYDWYREFLEFMLNAQAYTWFAKLVAVGEFAVGIALLAGIFTGIAAFFGAFMNWNFMLAGSASTNPVMGLLGLGIVLAWKTAGWWGLDRWVLPMLGAPWQPGRLFGHEVAVPGRRPQTVAGELQQWAGILVAVGMALFALITLTGAWQIVLLLIAAVIAGAFGLGLVPPALRRALAPRT